MRIIVTGGTSGIGYGVACLAVERGWEVTIIGRNRTQGAKIAAELGVNYLYADLSLMSDVRRLVEQLEEPIHALALCAGGVYTGKEVRLTSEGLETTFATNYLSKFTLSEMLLQQNKIVSGGCIAMVGGNGAHKNVSTNWTAPHAGLQAAMKAALAVDLYAADLAKRYPQLRVHACYPGMVRTNLFQEAPLLFRLLSRLFGQPIAKGSSYLGRLILEKHSGVHWKRDRPMRFRDSLPEGQEAEALWAYSRQHI
ncbi:SDR family NAD(P)-dependent oxidoreductase [Paenibacillus sp. MMS18-CY102]|uniref:SDR family NAD(P)-dependent oxidoreductase n=1 Tax=Paenibacillus sp. MMS18-CY102 TaxID=2682849 RepID=UPI0013667F57|nr:SDR family NAD(P)-dependent oxidoreductase [Paenibacillus sp. MMS18-CY102]MWC30746.1 SDR family NAD(P)-dependent oxidoreductase [Paenibacillus sp. MMS18-CY102]